jgi:lysophospholipid acyltransferase (LPLAT)-like uncharacterized protein
VPAGEAATRAAVTLGRPVLRALAATWRIRRHGAEFAPGSFDRSRPAVYVFWHAQILPLSWAHRRRGLVALISQHQDGEHIARIVRSWGFGTARGSSTRGGSAGLRQLVRALEGGVSVAVSPDGPRGPAEVAKPGAFAAARLAGVPLVPVFAVASRAWRLRSWDRFVVPQPFARVDVAYGTPVPSGSAESGSLAQLAEEVTVRLRALAGALE